MLTDFQKRGLFKDLLELRRLLNRLKPKTMRELIKGNPGLGEEIAKELKRKK